MEQMDTRGEKIMTILVDIDSTITNFAEVLLFVNNARAKSNYQYSDITSYDWFDKTFSNPWQPTTIEKFWDKVQVNPKAVSTIERWIEQGHKVYLVTASHFNNTLGYKIKRTLEPFNPKLINERNVVIAQDKSVIMGDVMIDDCVGNLVKFNGVRICYTQPWNEKYIDIFRYNDWNKINSIVEVYNYILLSK